MASNTVKNGKGPNPVKGVNWRAYWESELWENMGPNKKRVTKSEQSALECSEPAEHLPQTQSDVHV